jgi:glycosyltransferase involved in cell wall biosynthesis
MPLSVTIITPSFNQAQFLERTIRSVLAQSSEEPRFAGPIEHWVIDGGSRDGSVEILERYGGRLHWISEKDRGHPDAVNKGLARATGDIIGWLNSDDIFYPGAVATVMDVFERRPDVDVVYGDGNHIDEHDRFIEPYPTEDWSFERLKECCFLCQPAVFFRRRLVERFGPLDVQWHYALDYEYWLRLGQNGARFVHIGAVLAATRLHAATKTLGSRVKVHSENNDMLAALFGRVSDRWLFAFAHAVLDDRGLARGTPRYSIEVALRSWAAAVRWNGRISPPMLKLGSQWIGDGLRKGLR